MSVQPNSYAERITSWFDHHADNLRKHYIDTKSSLDAWETSSRYEIEQHANQQRAALKSFYDQQVQSIKQTFETINRDRVNIEANIHFKGAIENLEKLVSQCQTLKFAVSAVYVEEKSSVFIYFSSDEEIRQKKKNQPVQNKNQEKMFTSTLVLSMVEKPNKNHATTPDSPFELIDPVDEQFKSVRSRSIQNDFDQCTVCHMIFPKHLSDEQRSTHLIQHE